MTSKELRLGPHLSGDAPRASEVTRNRLWQFQTFGISTEPSKDVHSLQSGVFTRTPRNCDLPLK